jgi:hypothetical protein
MTNNERITRASYALVRGTSPVTAPRVGGFCLQLVRLVIEDAMRWPSHEFYRRHLTHRVERAAGDDTDPWARDVERTMRMQGHAIAVPASGNRYVTKEEIATFAEPGDILYRWDTARTPAGTFVGHVGILLHGDLVLENVNPAFRKRSLHNSHNRTLTLTGIEDFAVTLVARLPE